jgi:hypothetical protein
VTPIPMSNNSIARKVVAGENEKGGRATAAKMEEPSTVRRVKSTVQQWTET